MIRARLNPAPPPEIAAKPVVGVMQPLPLAGAHALSLADFPSLAPLVTAEW